MILYLLRHGETEWNKIRRLQGRSDVPLNEKGIELALQTGEGMKDVVIDYVISSPLSRAMKTALCVMGDRQIPFETDDRLIEIAFGDWEGLSMLKEEGIPKAYREGLLKDPLKCEVPPKGESFRDVQKRTGEFLMALSKRKELWGKRVLISCHGAAGRCLLSHFYEDHDDIWRGGVPRNCAVSILEMEEEKVTTIEELWKASRVIELDKLYYEADPLQKSW